MRDECCRVKRFPWFLNYFLFGLGLDFLMPVDVVVENRDNLFSRLTTLNNSMACITQPHASRILILH